jgi:hypothetical protein
MYIYIHSTDIRTYIHNPYHTPQNAFAHAAPAACITTCIDGGPHDFQHVAAENEKKSLVGGVKAMFMGTGGGAKAKSSSDKGQRVILYCRKCGQKDIA